MIVLWVQYTLAMRYRMPYDRILEAMSYGLSFKAKDEAGNCFPSDITFLRSLENDFKSTFAGLLGFDPVLDLQVIENLNKQYKVQLEKLQITK